MNPIYVLLCIESYDGLEKSHDDIKAEMDDIGCSLYGSLEAAQAAAQASFDKSFGDDDLPEDPEERYELQWTPWGGAVLSPSKWVRWNASNDSDVDYREYEIRLLSVA